MSKRIVSARKQDSFEKYLNQVRLNWLRTQNLPVDVQKAIFVIEINMFNKYFSQIGNHEEEKFRKLETVIRKKALIRMKNS